MRILNSQYHVVFGGIGFLLRNYILDTAVGRLVNLDRRPRYRYRARHYYKDESVYSDLDGNRTGCEWRSPNQTFALKIQLVRSFATYALTLGCEIATWGIGRDGGSRARLKVCYSRLPANSATIGGLFLLVSSRSAECLPSLQKYTIAPVKNLQGHAFRQKTCIIQAIVDLEIREGWAAFPHHFDLFVRIEILRHIANDMQDIELRGLRKGLPNYIKCRNFSSEGYSLSLCFSL